MRTLTELECQNAAGALQDAWYRIKGQASNYPTGSATREEYDALAKEYYALSRAFAEATGGTLTGVSK